MLQRAKNFGSTRTSRVANQSRGKQQETDLCKSLGFCSSCECNLDDDDDETNGLIECDSCRKWICRTCADVSPEEFTVIGGNERFHRFCDDRDLLAMASIENSKKVDRKKVNINPGEMQCLVLSRVTKLMDKMEAKNDLHLQKTERITKSYADALKKENELITNKVSSQVSSINKNLEKIAQAPVIAATKVKDRDSRKECVIVSGVPESYSDDHETRVEHDLQKMKKICVNGLDIKVSIDKITRMKPKKPRSARGPWKWGSRTKRWSGWWSRMPRTWLRWRGWRKYSSNQTWHQQRGKRTGDCNRNWRRNARNQKKNRTAQSGSYAGTRSSTQPGFRTPHGMTEETASK